MDARKVDSNRGRDYDAYWRKQLSGADYLNVRLVGNSVFQHDDPSTAILSHDWLTELVTRLLFCRPNNTRVDYATMTVAGAHYLLAWRSAEVHDSDVWSKVRWLMAYYAARGLSHGQSGTADSGVVEDFARAMFVGLPCTPIPWLADSIVNICMAPAYVLNASLQHAKEEQGYAESDDVSEHTPDRLEMYESLLSCIDLWLRAPEDFVVSGYLNYWRLAVKAG